jgi:hypothetical protein
VLERRELFASDFGDAPLPYPTLLAEGGAEHVAIGPMLGRVRDAENDGVHSTGAVRDDDTGHPDDEGGVTFGTIRTGQLQATATVSISGGAGKLDAWIDFNRDGAWGGPGEQIADSVSLSRGENTIAFDVPSWASDGRAYARFRLSTAGNLGVGGLASDGEVEDYVVTIEPPEAACGCFVKKDVNFSAAGANDVYATDVDRDGDTDILATSYSDEKVAWYENLGNDQFVPHTISKSELRPFTVNGADVDSDGDTDVISGGAYKLNWYENDGNQHFTIHSIPGMSSRVFVHADDVDSDGDMDILAGTGSKVAWHENDGNQNFTTNVITQGAVGASSVYTADIDSDGDIDVVSSSSDDDKIAWY